MSKILNPNEIAREAIKSLVAKKVAPTPDAYTDAYFQISGEPLPREPFAETLSKALNALPVKDADIKRLLTSIDTALTERDWETLPHLIFKVVELQGGQTQFACTWSELIRQMIKQWDIKNAGISPVKKRDVLEATLRSFEKYPNLLHEKLLALVKSWEEAAKSSIPIEVAEDEIVEPENGGDKIAVVAEVAPWREMLALALRECFAEGFGGHQELASDALTIAATIEVAASQQQYDDVSTRLRRLLARVDFHVEQDQRIAHAITNLLQLMCANIDALAGDDGWMKGQIALVQELLGQPLNPLRLYEAEAHLKEVVGRQRDRRIKLDEAQQGLKELLGVFVNRLGQIAQVTGGYGNKVESYSRRIAEATGLTDIREVLDDLSQETRQIQSEIGRSHDELVAAKEKVSTAEARIAALEAELKSVSEKVREDQLTGALNRRGFDEAFVAEIARIGRSNAPLSLAMLDLDNFKRLNDHLGHQAGDDALRHLVVVVKNALRPSDIVARYGGEEFVILMPETDVDEGAQVMRRVQRELTKRFFLHNNERLLITFSAGVTRFRSGESQDTAIERADHAMYRAKKAGKNQVLISQEDLA